MTPNLPPIVRTAERLLLEVEQAVRRFARFYRYEFGADLRRLAMKIVMLSHRAWREVELRTTLLSHLDRSVKQMKLSLQMGSLLRAFASRGQFDALSRIAFDLGNQVGGWKKSQHHPKGQNSTASARSERAQVLSPRAASSQANT